MNTLRNIVFMVVVVALATFGGYVLSNVNDSIKTGSVEKPSIESKINSNYVDIKKSKKGFKIKVKEDVKYPGILMNIINAKLGITDLTLGNWSDTYFERYTMPKVEEAINVYKGKKVELDRQLN